MCLTITGVIITPRAARFMRLMMRMHAAPAGAGMRLQARPGGCSGIDSSFDIVSEPDSGDAVFERDGARLFLPEASGALLRGYTIDYAESRLDGGLCFIPPEGVAASACGSGTATGANGAKVIFMRSTTAAARRG
jgi:iron-sulfur cluster assembly accessory protein